jgi:hypothetical protein
VCRLRNSWAAISGLDRPARASRAICASCGVRSLCVPAVRLRAVSPVAPVRGGPARRTPACRSRRTCRARCAAAPAPRPGGARGAATRRTAGARGRDRAESRCGSVSTASPTRNRSGAAPSRRPERDPSASRCGPGRPSRRSSSGAHSRCRPANASSISDSTPTALATCTPAAAPTRYSSSADLPTPASPRTTSARPRPDRRSPSRPSSAARSASRFNSAGFGLDRVRMPVTARNQHRPAGAAKSAGLWRFQDACVEAPGQGKRRDGDCHLQPTDRPTDLSRGVVSARAYGGAGRL